MDSRYENLLNSGIKNVVQFFFDNFLESNAEFRSNAGLKMTVTRSSIGKCCDWCQAMVGTYDYDERPANIYQRHENCTCIVTTRTKRGTIQDAWSRKEYQTERDARIARAEEIIKEQSMTREERIAWAKEQVDEKRERYNARRRANRHSGVRRRRA